MLTEGSIHIEPLLSSPHLSDSAGIYWEELVPFRLDWRQYVRCHANSGSLGKEIGCWDRFAWQPALLLRDLSSFPLMPIAWPIHWAALQIWRYLHLSVSSWLPILRYSHCSVLRLASILYLCEIYLGLVSDIHYLPLVLLPSHSCPF